MEKRSLAEQDTCRMMDVLVSHRFPCVVVSLVLHTSRSCSTSSARLPKVSGITRSAAKRWLTGGMANPSFYRGLRLPLAGKLQRVISHEDQEAV